MDWLAFSCFLILAPQVLLKLFLVSSSKESPGPHKGHTAVRVPGAYRHCWYRALHRSLLFVMIEIINNIGHSFQTGPPVTASFSGFLCCGIIQLAEQMWNELTWGVLYSHLWHWFTSAADLFHCSGESVTKVGAHIQECASKAALKFTVGSQKEESVMKEGDFTRETLDFVEIVESKWLSLPGR